MQTPSASAPSSEPFPEELFNPGHTAMSEILPVPILQTRRPQGKWSGSGSARFLPETALLLSLPGSPHMFAGPRGCGYLSTAVSLLCPLCSPSSTFSCLVPAYTSLVVPPKTLTLGDWPVWSEDDKNERPCTQRQTCPKMPAD